MRWRTSSRPRWVSEDVVVESLDSADDRRNYRVSFDKVTERLGFKPQYDLRKGIREMSEAIGQRSGLRNFEDPSFSNLKVLQDRFDNDGMATPMSTPQAVPLVLSR